MKTVLASYKPYWPLKILRGKYGFIKRQIRFLLSCWVRVSPATALLNSGPEQYRVLQTTCGATVLPANLVYLMSGQSFLTQKNWVLTQKRPDSKYTGLSRHTVARQVVNKTLYCSGPEFNTLTVAIKNNSIPPWRRQKGYFSPNFKLSLLLEAMDL